ncbi:MAG: putative peptide zinc metalloprotease protein [Actinomycetota bacterium]|jgi:putative peptide zinc metalloprotease protein|nr:putative peptide zinc metalloprotease protein [Actinomycetota bacterium]
MTRPPGTTDTTSRLARPKLVEGVTLLGEYASSGYEDPPHLARRPDGTVIQLHPLVFAVAESMDGDRDLDAIAADAAERTGAGLDAANVERIIDTKLRSTGLATTADGADPEIAPSDPFLALKMRAGFVPERVVNAITRLFRPLFATWVVALVLVALAAFDVWLFFVHGIGQSTRSTVYHPHLFLVVLGLMLASAAFHETGHASGLAASGGRPGKMGAGVYIAWPAFYTDVTDAYRLPRSGRLRTDLGGIYFNGLFVLVVGGIYLLTGFAPLLLVAFLLQIEVVHQLLPLLRLDGYYILADLVGVPDLFRRVGPVLKSAIPGRPEDPSVRALTRKARRIVAAWVFILVPFLLTNMVLIVASLPKLVATAWDSAVRLLGTWGGASGLDRAVLVVQLVALAIPLLGITLALVGAVRRAIGGLQRWSSGSTGRRLVAVLGLSAAVLLLAVAWWPDGGWRPYTKNDKGTVQETLAQVIPVGRGTPLFRNLFGGYPGSNGPGSGVTSPSRSTTGGPGAGGGSGVLPTGVLPSIGDLVTPAVTLTPAINPPDVGGVPVPGVTASVKVSAPTSTSSPLPSVTASVQPTPTTSSTPTASGSILPTP